MWYRCVIVSLLLGACQDDRGEAAGAADATLETLGGDGEGAGAGSTTGASDPDAVDGAPASPGDGTSAGTGDDAAGAPAGTACETEDECRSGWCVPSAIGQVCVDPCIDECQAGQQCIPAAESGTDPVYLCIPFVAPPSPDAGVGSDAESDVSDSDASSEADAGAADGASDAGPADDSVAADGAPEPDATGPDTVIADTDSDGDGIPDDQDNLPCLAIYLVVYNQDVTAASLTVNGIEVVAANAFPTSEPITVFINPTSGENSLSLGGHLTGSPSDTLTLVVVDTTGHIYFATVIERNPGKPVDHSYTFEIDVACP